MLRLVAPHSVTTEAALPTADEERRHPARADQRYVAATRLLETLDWPTAAPTPAAPAPPPA